MKVLIIEDDIQLNQALTEFFNIKKFKSIGVTNGLDAINMIDNKTFNLYIIDINIPEISGLDILQYIRKTELDTPIIIITASLEIENLSVAFKNGCNEYIKKPFHLKELDIRINKLLKMSTKNIITLNKELDYNLNTEEFIYQQQALTLRYKEKRFCTLMIENINNYVTFERIYDYVWEGEIRENYPLRQLISELRRKLPNNIIHTQVKMGYIIKQI
ncbi:MAG: DNA-binding response regulator, OmpR family, contains REC and winged-helix (WHTH) domain [uncultured Sulfurovum sp.]|uniref:DNA-binding response regulator, OmpR family, contains REC and winged-helix (WHTH) domain n=1 Tax=uncultured Sulfurovum sp. TaxID=269237 RepID=A0A6S6U1X8_9BACT|nr:MAG: DNA-binding response regulator, OmpR family, contains REC and winged-helix (WHTH) domain [uncultured Sulfurovum sp.]